jgi:protoheme IX farnesyltransferase
MLGYIIAFAATALLIAFVAPLGYGYLAAVLVFSVLWLAYALRSPADEALWAKRVFLVSLVVLLGVSLAMSVDARPARTAPYPLSAG